MKATFPVVVISAIVTSIVVTILLKFVGNPMGIPDGWNSFISEILALAVALEIIRRDKFSKQDAPEESTESSQT